MNKIKQHLISIDGSTTNTGIAVFDYNTKELIDYTYIKPDNPYETNKNMNKQEENEIKKKNMDYRIIEMIKGINIYLKKYKPKVIVIEDTYMGKDGYAYKKLCHIQGLVLSYSIEHKRCLIYFYSPTVWRKAVGIPNSENKVKLKRKELKNRAIELVKQIYDIDVSDDIADSICIGLAFFNKEKEINNK